MDVTIALQRAVRSFALGTEALAAHMGITKTSLNHKVSPTYPTAHCSPEEMLQIMEATADHSAFYALADRLGYFVFPSPPLDEGDVETTQALARTVCNFGEFISASATAMADGRVSANELREIERECAEAIAATHALVRVAQAQHARLAKASPAERS